MAKAPSKTFINDFSTGPVLPRMITFAFPLFLSNLLQAIYNVVDMIVVGQVMGAAGLSGLSIGGDVLSLLTFVSMGFASASQIIISQYIGAGLRDKLSRFIGTMSSFLFLCAVVFSVGCLLTRNQILGVMNTPIESWDQAMSYSTTCMFGLVFIYGYNAVSSILRGMGDSKRPFVFISISAVLNLILDLLFVVEFRWEAFGAALATVIAQGFSFLTSLIYLYMKRENFGFAFTAQHFRMDGKELSTLIKLGIPFAIRLASVRFSKIFVNAWINDYGVTISAATGVAHKVETFGNLMGNAVTTAGSSMVGQNIGAGKYDRASRVLGAAFFLNSICFLLVILVVYFFPNSVFGLFTSDTSVLLVCMEYVPIAMTYFVCSALRSSMNAFTGGCGNYKFNFVVAVIDGIVARVGFSLLFGLAMGMGYVGFWLGNALAGVTPFVLGAVYYLAGSWRKPSSIIADSE